MKLFNNIVLANTLFGVKEPATVKPAIIRPFVERQLLGLLDVAYYALGLVIGALQRIRVLPYRVTVGDVLAAILTALVAFGF